MDDFQKWIDQQVKSNNVLLFIKGTKENPLCGFSSQVILIMEHIGVDFQAHNVMSRDGLRQAVKEYSNWPTFPQLYVKGKFIGGCDIIREMFQSGELISLFEEAGIPTGG
ncbi:MAG: Grx4 family monothiol glutaredoxin [Alphaproteobacteria bacterium]|nr:Grx4 family monothiol glutaredoxin [Alphaproteobacteria bacterium]